MTKLYIAWKPALELLEAKQDGCLHATDLSYGALMNGV